MLRCVTAAGNQHRAPPNGVQFRPLPRYATAWFTTHAAHRLRPRPVYCNSCRHQADADLRALVLRGQGDVPLSGPRRRTGFREEPLGSVDHVRLLLPAAGADPRSDR